MISFSRFRRSGVWILAVTLVFSDAPAAFAAPPVSEERIAELKTAFDSHRKASSQARKRLAIKRMVRDATSLLNAHPEAPNRFEIITLLFEAQKTLVALEKSPPSRKNLLETAALLAKAPDSYAEFRIDADLLLSQTKLARSSAGRKARIAALRPLIERYRDTPGEAKMLRVALVMALELGDHLFIREIRNELSTHFAGDLEMIAFQRDKLGGQIFGAPFCGTFQRSDGKTSHFPSDTLGLSTGLYFWSRENGGLETLELLVEAWEEKKAEVTGRLQIISINVDELPDAGEKILRDLGVDWPALHLPGGTGNAHCKAFARRTPAMITLSPTGYAALYMAGASRRSSGTTSAIPDYSRWISSSLARSWTRPRFVNQFLSITTGDFFVTASGSAFDPSLPPEIKASLPVAKSPATSLPRDDRSIPIATLEEIQNCFVPPPLRYRLELPEMKANYLKAIELGEAALSSHPEATDQWLVHNRIIIARMGLWKLTGNQDHLQAAVKTAATNLKQPLPKGAGLISRFCLARHSLRSEEAHTGEVIDQLLEGCKDFEERSSVFAAASLLALDRGDRGLHELYRGKILKSSIEHPMMWTFGSFLLNRYQRYQLYRAPFVSGRSFGWRQDYSLSFGAPEEARRHPKIILPDPTGKPTTVVPPSPDTWTVLLVNGQPVADKRAPLYRDLGGLLKYVEQRPVKDLRVVVALTMGEDEATRTYLAKNPLDCPVVIFPGGSNHPLINQLGILSEDETTNLVIFRPDGSIARVVSGLSMQTKARGKMVTNCLEWHDEQTILQYLEEQRLDDAKDLIFTLAPPPPPGDPGKTNKQPNVSLSHLRSRARVYLATGELEKALADAKAAVRQKTLADAGMSIRTEELAETEALLKQIEEKMETSRR